MAIVLCDNVSSLSQDQFRAFRSGKIGGSDIGAIAGLVSYRTPLQVWMQFTGKLPPIEENRNMRLGRRREDDVAQEFSIETGIKTEKVNQIWQHENIDWAIASPDFWAGENKDSLLEAKTTKAHNFKHYEEKIPESAHAQLIWQLGIGKLSNGFVACVSGDNDYIDHKCQFDKDVFNGLLSLGEQFMDLVKSDTPPTLVGGDYDLVKKLVPEIIPAKKISVSHIKNLIDDYKKALEREKLLKKEIDGMKAQIRFSMGDAAIGTIGDETKVKILEVYKSDYVVKAQKQIQLRVY